MARTFYYQPHKPGADNVFRFAFDAEPTSSQAVARSNMSSGAKARIAQSMRNLAEISQRAQYQRPLNFVGGTVRNVSGKVSKSRVQAFNAGFARTALENASVKGAQTFVPKVSRIPDTVLLNEQGRRASLGIRSNVPTATATSLAGFTSTLAPTGFAMLWRALWDNFMYRLLDEFYEFSCGGPDGMFTSRRSPDCGEESIWGMSGPTAPIYPYTIGSVANGFYTPTGIAQIRGVITGQWTRPTASPRLPVEYAKGAVNVVGSGIQLVPMADALVAAFTLDAMQVQPLPYHILPHRHVNPWRARHERFQNGYTLEPEPDTATQTRPVRLPPPPPPKETGTAIAPVPNGVPVKPGKKVQERKTKVEKAYWSFLQAYGAYTEAVDIVKAFYNALPGKLRAQLRAENGGRTLSAAEKLMAVLKYSRSLSPDAFAKFALKGLYNTALSQAQDVFMGKLMKPMDDFIRMAIPAFGERMLVRAAVKAAWQVGKQANAEPKEGL